MKAKRLDNGTVRIFCLGCKSPHDIDVDQPRHNGAQWTFNENFERPTFSPSLHIMWGSFAGEAITPENEAWLQENSGRCHSWITDGRIQYLPDSTHELSGQTVDLPDLEN